MSFCRSFPASFALALAACGGGDNIAPPDGGNDAMTTDARSDGGADAPGETGSSPDLYVDAAAGDDGNPGTLSQPLKTIKKAFTMASRGDVIHLLPGTFDAASGDDFSTPVPDGVSIMGAAPDDGGSFAVTLEGSNDPLVFSGAGSLANVAMSGFAHAIAATAGSQTIANVAISGGAFVVAGGSAQTTVTSLQGTNGAILGVVSDAAQLTFHGGTLASPLGGVFCTDAATFSADNLTADGVTSTFVNAGVGCSATLTSVTLTNLAGTAVNMNGTSSVTLDTVSTNGGTPVVATGGTLTIKGGSFTNVSNCAVASSQTTIVITGGLTVSGCGQWGFAYNTGSLTATDMTISGCGLGGIYTEASLKLRSCTIKDNTGIGIEGYLSPTLDLGTANSPGNNTWTNNSNTDVNVTAINNETINAVGNTWNASIQGADASGHYGAGVMSGFSQNGKNFDTGVTTQLKLGP